jgi:hypothetical protein
VEADSGPTFTAPFTVVSRSGQKIMVVREGDDPNQKQNTLVLYDNQESPVVSLVSTQAGGGVVTLSHEGVMMTAMGADTEEGHAGSNGSLYIWDHEEHRIADIYRGRSGGQGLGIYDATDDKAPRALLLVRNTVASVQLASESGDLPQVSLEASPTSNYLFVQDPSNNPIAILGELPPSKAKEGEAAMPTPRGLAVYHGNGEILAAVAQNKAENGSVSVFVNGDHKAPRAENAPAPLWR